MHYFSGVFLIFHSEITLLRDIRPQRVFLTINVIVLRQIGYDTLVKYGNQALSIHPFDLAEPLFLLEIHAVRSCSDDCGLDMTVPEDSAGRHIYCGFQQGIVTDNMA